MNGLKQTNYHSIQKCSLTLFLCHKSNQKNDLRLTLPILRIDGVELQRKASIKFVGLRLDENLTWKDHINTIENKISKKIWLIFRAKKVLNKDSLTKLCYSYIHCCLNYANMAWCSTHKTNLYEIHLKQTNNSSFMQ